MPYLPLDSLVPFFRTFSRFFFFVFSFFQLCSASAENETRAEEEFHRESAKRELISARLVKRWRKIWKKLPRHGSSSVIVFDAFANVCLCRTKDKARSLARERNQLLHVSLELQFPSVCTILSILLFLFFLFSFFFVFLRRTRLFNF